MITERQKPGAEWEEYRAVLKDSGILMETMPESDYDEISDPDIFAVMFFLEDKHPEFLTGLKLTLASKNDFPILGDTPGVFAFDQDDETKKLEPVVYISQDFDAIDRKKRKISVELVAQRLGKKLDELSDKELKLFVLLHELGHFNEYKDKFLSASDGNHNEAFQMRQEVQFDELRSLPIPGIIPGAAIKAFYDYKGDVEAMLGYFLKFLNRYHEGFVFDEQKFRDNVDTYGLEKLLELHERAYKELDSEKTADDFATRVMKEYQGQFGLNKE